VSTFIPPGNQEPGGVTYSALWGFHAGIIVQLSVGSFYIQPNFVYESIGRKLKGIGTYFTEGAFAKTNSLHYLQVPINILYHTKSGKYFFGGGPYVAFALSGTLTDNNTSYFYYEGGSTSSNNTYTEKFAFSGSNNLEFGVNLLAGVHVPGNFIFTAGAGIAQQNKVYNLSIGRMFW
jgi:hypothetical protein